MFMVKHEVVLEEEVRMRDSINVRLKPVDSKKFAIELIQGWFPNIITKDTEHGVDKLRIINRITNFYHEYVEDLKTNKVIRSITEKLTDHK